MSLFETRLSLNQSSEDCVSDNEADEVNDEKEEDKEEKKSLKARLQAIQVRKFFTITLD